ncbi:MAG TPA: hypothetical protein VIZ65_11630 [Cellvibrionaceae bacterium]
MHNLKHQTGDFLIEAMIGTLITALVSLGTLKITSHVMLTQEEMVRQETIVTVLREQLYTHNPNDPVKNQCVGGAKADAESKLAHLNRGSVTYTSECLALSETYSLDGKALAPVALPVVYVSIKVPVASDPNGVDEYALGVNQ